MASSTVPSNDASTLQHLIYTANERVRQALTELSDDRANLSRVEVVNLLGLELSAVKAVIRTLPPSTPYHTPSLMRAVAGHLQDWMTTRVADGKAMLAAESSQWGSGRRTPPPGYSIEMENMWWKHPVPSYQPEEAPGLQQTGGQRSTASLSLTPTQATGVSSSAQLPEEMNVDAETPQESSGKGKGKAVQKAKDAETTHEPSGKGKGVQREKGKGKRAGPQERKATGGGEEDDEGGKTGQRLLDPPCKQCVERGDRCVPGRDKACFQCHKRKIKCIIIDAPPKIQLTGPPEPSEPPPPQTAVPLATGSKLGPKSKGSGKARVRTASKRVRSNSDNSPQESTDSRSSNARTASSKATRVSADSGTNAQGKPSTKRPRLHIQPGPPGLLTTAGPSFTQIDQGSSRSGSKSGSVADSGVSPTTSGLTDVVQTLMNRIDDMELEFRRKLEEQAIKYTAMASVTESLRQWANQQNAQVPQVPPVAQASAAARPVSMPVVGTVRDEDQVMEDVVDSVAPLADELLRTTIVDSGHSGPTGIEERPVEPVEHGEPVPVEGSQSAGRAEEAEVADILISHTAV